LRADPRSVATGFSNCWASAAWARCIARIMGAHMYLGQLYLRQGLHPRAIEELTQTVALAPGVTKPSAMLGHAYAVSGQAAKARHVLEQLLKDTRHVSPYDVALIHVGLGNTAEAFTWLERAYESRTYDLVTLNVDRRLDVLRSDQRFINLVTRVGLPRR